MNFKYKFGWTEVIAMITGSLVIVIIDLIFRYNNFMYADIVKSVLIVSLAALFGSPTGVVAALASSLLLAAILKLDVSVIIVAAYIIIALSIGHYASVFGIRDGLFKGKNILIFFLVKVLAEMFAWLFFLPLLDFYLTRENLFDTIRQNMMTVLAFTAADVLLIPAFMLVSYLISKKDR